MKHPGQLTPPSPEEPASESPEPELGAEQLPASPAQEEPAEALSTPREARPVTAADGSSLGSWLLGSDDSTAVAIDSGAAPVPAVPLLGEALVAAGL
jgi:hypothetical protein